MKKVSELTREEKIELIRKLQAGEVNVVNGNIVELSPIIISKGDKFFMGEQEFSKLDDIYKLLPEGQSIIILPAKNLPEEE